MKRIFFFTTILALLVLLVIPLIYAFEATTATYDIDSFHQGSAGKNGSTSTYTFRFTETYQQGSNPDVTTLTYKANSGWFIPGGLNSPPKIFNVSAIITSSINAGPALTAVESSTDPAIYGPTPDFLMEVSDANGIGNLDDSTAVITLTRIGEPDIVSTSCTRVVGEAFDNPSTGIGYANYTCPIDLPWYAKPGVWDVGADIDDLNPNTGVRTYTESLTYIMPMHSSFTINPSALTFATLAPGSVDNTPTNNPITISNTGNVDSTDVIITAQNLIGINLEQIDAGDFTVGLIAIAGEECDVSETTTESMIDNTPVSMTLTAGATVPRGDYVTSPLLYLEELNVCLTLVDPTLSAQFYRTSHANTQAWDTTTFF